MAAGNVALLARGRLAAGVASLAVVIAVLAFPRGLAAQGEVPQRAEEYRLKAAIIYNLAKFVEWPSTSFADASTPFTVCVLGVDPFGSALDETMRGHSVAGRTIATRRLMAVEAGCHAMFVSASELKRLPVIVDQLRGQSVLLIGEDSAFLARGGMILLATQGDRVRFAISAEAAEQAHLKVSARVMALAAPAPAQGATP